jgi:hypothetical protein
LKIITAATMVSGEAGGKKRKASAAEDITSPAARREPRRGLGVAELERIRVALEMAERCYAAASSLSVPQHHPPPALPPPPTTLVVHAAGVAAAPAHHQHVRTPADSDAAHPLPVLRHCQKIKKSISNFSTRIYRSEMELFITFK